MCREKYPWVLKMVVFTGGRIVVMSGMLSVLRACFVKIATL